MRDEHDRRARLAVERLEQLDDARAGLAVEVARRLVGEEEARRVAERARDGDALLLAARELVGKWCAPVAEPDAGEQLAGARAARRRRRAARAAPARSRAR